MVAIGEGDLIAPRCSRRRIGRAGAPAHAGRNAYSGAELRYEAITGSRVQGTRTIASIGHRKMSITVHLTPMSGRLDDLQWGAASALHDDEPSFWRKRIPTPMMMTRHPGEDARQDWPVLSLKGVTRVTRLHLHRISALPEKTLRQSDPSEGLFSFAQPPEPGSDLVFIFNILIILSLIATGCFCFAPRRSNRWSGRGRCDAAASHHRQRIPSCVAPYWCRLCYYAPRSMPGFLAFAPICFGRDPFQYFHRNVARTVQIRNQPVKLPAFLGTVSPSPFRSG